MPNWCCKSWSLSLVLLGPMDFIIMIYWPISFKLIIILPTVITNMVQHQRLSFCHLMYPQYCTWNFSWNKIFWLHWATLFFMGKSYDYLKTINCNTVGVKSQNVNPILHCKTPIWRLGVWPKWVGPAHSTLGQLTQYTSRLRYSKMSDFHQVVLKWHTFVFLSGQLWLILVLAWWWVKCKCVPFQNYWAKKAHILVF